ncbi:putative LRR receptor-like serine/threonine-protein kinase [Cinnamomum micranthum f. kanehirae]|uniref:Putative LRR receptor-like serine/threonine-protein kinase n=1 Tax=Cinnamomum micranthum f. kanehirae TaxID=337451 RepID=A0A3S4NJT2_9MAGN|nr:putative LRR receptor-like serine/threonine-protein kinase [Cinnamomum micranthum f. kanehirae]
MALVLSFLANLLTFAVVLHAQSGFLSIDCGIDEDLSYTDDKNQMFYTSDATFIDTGSNKDISKDYISQTPRQYQNLRFFPDGTRNCYTLTPVIRSNRYLLRASFMSRSAAPFRCLCGCQSLGRHPAVQFNTICA